MIKFVELTAPHKSEFRQAKILSYEVNEGDRVAIGDTLFKVKSGKNEIDLPSTAEGKIAEIITYIGENITISTALVLLETEVIKEAGKPIETVKPTAKKKKTKTKKKTKKQVAKSTQQQLDLVTDEPQQTIKDNIQSSSTMNITIPDLGVDTAKVVEILVKPGDKVEAEDPILSMESDKANMELPCPAAGEITEILVSLDQDVSEGVVVATLITESSADATAEQSAQEPEPKPVESSTESESVEEPQPIEKLQPVAEPQLVDVNIPDIGGDSAKVVEILVSVGDEIAVEDPILTLESDKASMDVPSPVAGKVETIKAAIDDDVAEGDLIIQLLSNVVAKPTSSVSKEPATPAASAPAPAAKQTTAPVVAATPTVADVAPDKKSHATPSVRRFARELGVTLGYVKGTGRKGRINKDDVKQYVKTKLTSGQSGGVASGAGIPSIPDVDFTKFGEIESLELNKIKRLTATNLHRAWVNIPHVTHHDEADSTQIDVLRKGLKEDYAKENIKISPLVFVIKACVAALQEFPTFNSSLHSSGEHLILKKYYNIGIAVDTPNGLVVPIIRDVNKKNIKQLSHELAELSMKARDKKLMPKDMQGGCFTISSLGGIGGRFFTPIVNAPEVAILGVTRTQIKPQWNGSEFVPVPMLPLSLSYDHRVIDGAEAARFSAFLCQQIADFSLSR